MQLGSMKGQMDSPLLIGVMVFVVILISAVIPVVQDNIESATVLGTQTNETFTLTSATQAYIPTQVSANDAAVSTVTFVGNLTTNLPAANYTVTDGAVTFALSPNANATDVAYNITYVFEPREYLNTAGQRTLVSLILLFIIIGGVLFVARSFDFI